jgi:hypothetical protein
MQPSFRGLKPIGDLRPGAHNKQMVKKSAVVFLSEDEEDEETHEAKIELKMEKKTT